MNDSPLQTHEVLNQPPPFLPRNLFTSDPILQDAVEKEGAGWAKNSLTHFGARVGEPEVFEWGNQANRYVPVLQTHNRYGYRIDEVEFHPAWHELMTLSIAQGLHSTPWYESKTGAHVARAAGMILSAQNEFGHLCPISMTYSVVPVLQKNSGIFGKWEEKLKSKTYDPAFKPIAEKKGVLLGMAMTEKQGGSDVRANTSQATLIRGSGPGAEFQLTGHKWFCSDPMCDAFLVLANTSKGLTCFLLPRWTPDGKRNQFFIQRLKDKLGNRSNASSEIEFVKAFAWQVGEEGRGVRTIIEMANHTRLDCVLGTTGMMRRAFMEACHHAKHREAFGKRLIKHPLMQNVLADLSLESEAALRLALRLARAYDRSETDAGEDAFARLATPVSKYWVCKRGPVVAFEAMEAMGGVGYVEETIFPRIYREMPLNSIWEGSGNIMCMDVLRVLHKEPEAFEAFWKEMEITQGANKHLDATVASAQKRAVKISDSPVETRVLVEQMGLALQASLMIRYAKPKAADAFCASRLGERGGKMFGSLAEDLRVEEIL